MEWVPIQFACIIMVDRMWVVACVRVIQYGNGLYGHVIVLKENMGSSDAINIPRFIQLLVLMACSYIIHHRCCVAVECNNADVTPTVLIYIYAHVQTSSLSLSLQTINPFLHPKGFYQTRFPYVFGFAQKHFAWMLYIYSPSALRASEKKKKKQQKA